METGIFRLSLLSPLYYVSGEEGGPFEFKASSDPLREQLFCFELDKSQLMSIEPDGEKLLGKLVFGAVSATEQAAKTAAGLWELPRGNYLLVQKREILDRNKIIDLLVEVQQEGLWQRLIPGDKAYLRYLFEDGKWVTQLLRPYTEPSATDP